MHSTNDIQSQIGMSNWEKIISMIEKETNGMDSIKIPYKSRAWTAYLGIKRKHLKFTTKAKTLQNLSGLIKLSQVLPILSFSIEGKLKKTQLLKKSEDF